MILTSCPLRVSLVGGSTDNPNFIEKYGYGSVISFPSTLRTYVTLHRDVFGANSIDKKYILNYSHRESVDKIEHIQNELIRECFNYFNMEQIICSLNSDVYSTGSGLASSSSYLMCLIKSIHTLRKEKITDFEVCKIANRIEKLFNPMVGQQDFYGSMGGLKRINFDRYDGPTIKYLGTDIFHMMDMYLIYTGVIRKSTKILETIDIHKSKEMLEYVDYLEESIHISDVKMFNEIISKNWETKKETSNEICGSNDLIDLDGRLSNDREILSHKLCGAGGGGYFLVFTKKDVDLNLKYDNVKKINISETGLKSIEL
jgi:D-glycero-alpha-D-manno-heptose-7-phosphate kinase